LAKGLRQLNVRVRKVRGINDQSDQFIRLADALAGFVSDSLEGEVVLRELYNQALKNKKLIIV
jgi:hypothetical protein